MEFKYQTENSYRIWVFSTSAEDRTRQRHMLLYDNVYSMISISGTSCMLGSVLLFSCSVISHSLPPHGQQHTRLPCPSPSPGVCSNSCPLSQWYNPTISSSVAPFSSCLRSFSLFPMSQFFTSGIQSIGVSASASVLPMNIQCWFLLGLTGLISLLSEGLSRVFSSTWEVFKSISSSVLHFFMVWLSHPYMTTGKTTALTIQTFVDKVMSVLFNALFRFWWYRDDPEGILKCVSIDNCGRSGLICFPWHGMSHRSLDNFSLFSGFKGELSKESELVLDGTGSEESRALGRFWGSWLLFGKWSLCALPLVAVFYVTPSG